MGKVRDTACVEYFGQLIEIWICEPLRKRKLVCLGRFEKLGLKPSIIEYVSLNSV